MYNVAEQKGGHRKQGGFVQVSEGVTYCPYVTGKQQNRKTAALFVLVGTVCMRPLQLLSLQYFIHFF